MQAGQQATCFIAQSKGVSGLLFRDVAETLANQYLCLGFLP